MTKRFRALAALAAVVLAGAGVQSSGGNGPTPAVMYVPPRSYVCYRATAPLTIDGKLNDAAWQAVPWTEDFVDIEGDAKPRPRFRTRVKMLWDDQYFYVAAELEEPHVWGTLTKHDSVIFQDNDFEVFIDPNGNNHHYAEFEINALNTGWDLLLTRPYRDGGRAINSWEIPGLKTAVHVDGTVNDPRDKDRGWTIELAFPWAVLGELAPLPGAPKDGDQWRVNFSRVEWQHEIADGKYRKVPKTPEDNWVWSPQHQIDMHQPELWGYVQFSTAKPGEAKFRPDPTGPARDVLYQVHKGQVAYRKANKHWAKSLEELNLNGLTHGTLTGPPILQLTDGLYQATVQVRDGARIHVRHDSLVWTEKK